MESWIHGNGYVQIEQRGAPDNTGHRLYLNAVELSNDELDTVAGGLAITLGDVGSFASDASNSYSLKQLQVGQQTFAGPTGSGTASVTNLTDIFSNAGQAIAVK
ncbi:CTB family bacteriocin [Dulcicalothrix desertica]|uniref:CTB family bacteriocin n=2 Tax=Dulcicalothrix desertica TaxID=32056 RepID=UPI00307EA1F2